MEVYRAKCYRYHETKETKFCSFDYVFTRKNKIDAEKDLKKMKKEKCNHKCKFFIETIKLK
jgi:hypothetical protein